MTQHRCAKSKGSGGCGGLAGDSRSPVGSYTLLYTEPQCTPAGLDQVSSFRPFCWPPGQGLWLAELKAWT